MGRLRTSTLNPLEIRHFREREGGIWRTHLRSAITRAGLTLEEFADIVQVDVKTVQRWLAGRTPYARHRTRVAGALDVSEHSLWPDAIPALTATEAHQPTTYETGDAIAGYAHATDSAAPDAAEILRAAVERMDLVVPDLGSEPGLAELLLTSAANGCQVRLSITNPDERVESLLGIDEIEVRASPAGEDHVLRRADDEILLALTRIGPDGASPPIIHLRRQVDGGLFDRLAEDFEVRWLAAAPLVSRDQLSAYLADTDLQARTESEPEPDRIPLPTSGRPSEAPPTPAADAPRRWPRRPT